MKQNLKYLQKKQTASLYIDKKTICIVLVQYSISFFDYLKYFLSIIGCHLFEMSNAIEGKSFKKNKRKVHRSNDS